MNAAPSIYCRRAARIAGLGLLAGFAVFFLAVSGVRAETAVAAKLSAADKADVARIETHFSAIRTLKSRFIQIASDGSVAGGRFFLARPGRMRFEYDPPTPILLIATGTLLIYYDKDLQQVSQTLLGTSPVAVLADDEVKFSGGITITRFEKGRGLIRITVAETDDAEDGSITLVFSDAPLALRQWAVTDPQGVTTTVTLTGVQTGVTLDPDLFRFDAPVQP